MTTENLKRQHEIAVGNRLLKSLSLPARFLRAGNDRDEPDVIYSCQDALLGIEVVTAYFDDSQAKVKWDLARGKIRRPSRGMICVWSGEEPDEKMFASIQRGVDGKCRRTYTGVDRVWLCIAHQAAGEAHVISAYVERLLIPTTHGFERIYIDYPAPSDEGGGWRSVELKSADSVHAIVPIV